MGRQVCHLCVYPLDVSLLLFHAYLWILPHLHFCISLSQRWQKIIISLLLHSLFALIFMSLNLLLNNDMLLQITLVTAEIQCLLSNTTFVIEIFGKSKRKTKLFKSSRTVYRAVLTMELRSCDYKRIGWRKKIILYVQADKERQGGMLRGCMSNTRLPP